ncbi:MAG: hypothetical protein K2I64_04235 [Muribaculaceae bacterium]|nr:hypothetical protein [Muribaculaceae bacterium]
MADNYLERRMEEHLRRQAAAKPSVSRRPALRAGEVAVRYPSVRVVVTDGCSVTGQAVIRAFRALGCRVAFTSDDAAAARRLAQTEGAQFHPDADAQTIVTRLTDAGDRPEAVIGVGERRIRFADGSAIAIPTGCVEPADVAAFCCYALHPSTGWMRG